MPKISAVATNYAKALFLSAKKAKSLAETSKDLEKFNKGFSQELAHELKNPVISKNDLVEIIGDVTKKMSLGKLTSNFFAAVAENRRIGLFQEIYAEYQELVKANDDILEIEIVTAKKAKKDQIDEIKNLVAKKYADKKILVKEVVQEKILGGFQVRIGAKLIDASLENQINKIGLACLEASN